MPFRNRDIVYPLLLAWMEGNGCCPPWPPEGSLTSIARRWSQLTRVRMRRTTPHPRPWDGPQILFDDALAFFDARGAGD